METCSSFEVRKGLSAEAIFSWGLSVSKELICETEISKTFFLTKGKAIFTFSIFFQLTPTQLPK